MAEDEEIDAFMANREECFDRFTFDDIFRFLLANGFSHEAAKDFICVRCHFSALVLQERIYNNFYKRIEQRSF